MAELHGDSQLKTHSYEEFQVGSSNPSPNPNPNPDPSPNPNPTPTHVKEAPRTAQRGTTQRRIATPHHASATPPSARAAAAAVAAGAASFPAVLGHAASARDEPRAPLRRHLHCPLHVRLHLPVVAGRRLRGSLLRPLRAILQVAQQPVE